MMPEPIWLDHLVVAVTVLVDPLWGAWGYRRLIERVRAGVANARIAAYWKTIIVQWTFTIALLSFWLIVDRPLAALGFVVPSETRLVVGSTVTLVVVAWLYTQWRAVMRMDEAGLAPLRAQMAAVADLVPHTRQEGALFRGVSVTAGVCEEIVCRGFLIWYLAAFVGTWPAVFIGAAIFGVLHLYQGTPGMIKTGLTGLVMGVLYVGTGSLIFPIILHTAIDLQGGAMARRVATPTMPG